jgi:hypothetical protein
MSIAAALEKIRQAGFVIEADGDHIAIEPFDELTVQQIEWLRGCKPDIIAALRSETAILDGGQAGNDIEPANQEPILATAYTPAGNMMMVEATSAAHAAWIERMNPKPVPIPMVRCCDCSNATITNGIASCGAGVDSGLPIAGHWATDPHPCAKFQAKPMVGDGLQENRGELGSVGRPSGNVSNGNNTAKGGNNLDYTKRRLKRDRPDLISHPSPWGVTWGNTTT